MVEAAKMSSPVSPSSYHVCLSFKSDESCTTFVDDLDSALIQSGIHAFRNPVKQETDRRFGLETRKAVKLSKVSVIVLSDGYVNTKWCLDELANTVERKEKLGHVILPVFYCVDPSHLRKQNGCCEKSFLDYEKEITEITDSGKKREQIARVQQWRVALKHVADLGGMVVSAGKESEQIQKTVEETWLKLGRSVFNVAPNLVGACSRVKKIYPWMEGESSSHSISVIYGTGGIGKTTIAKIIYHLYHEKFEVSGFVADINEITSRSNGMVQLHRHILTDILNGENVEVNDACQGTTKIIEALSGKTFFLVFDDLDSVVQLNALLGLRDWLTAGSKVMITTQNKSLLDLPNVFSYELTKLDDNESMQLFSLHAFRHEQPMIGYMDLSKELVEHCQGIPLALQVLGSSLADTTSDMWETTSKKLGKKSDHHITKLIEIGYDNLDDDKEKDLFLDIACYFVGKYTYDAERILNECNFFATTGIPTLVKKCLLTVNQQNKLVMHQLVREMGKKVILKEFPGQPEKYSRLWDSETALNVLREKAGTEFIECLSLSSLPQQPPLNSSMEISYSTSEREVLDADAFSRMHNLRLLQLNRVHISGSYKEFPKKLKWLCWHSFPSSSIPGDFPMANLSILEMHNCNLRRIWEGTKILTSLKVLDLSHSHSLISTPDFSCVPILERLSLEECVNLVKVHKSIGGLRRLASLSLRCCINLRKLPKEIERLKSLETLNLSGCSNINISAAINKNSGLFSIKLLPSAFSRGSRKLEYSELQFFPRTLRSLNLSACNIAENVIPSDLSFLLRLLHLDLSENHIASLPESIKTLSSLQSLKLVNCTRLELLPKLPLNLKTLDARSCRSLKKISNLPNYMRSLELQLKDCEKLVEVSTVFKLTPMSNIDTVVNLWGEINLNDLKGIQMELFNNLTNTKSKGPVQELYEFGIYSTFLPGKTVPKGFKTKSIEHSNRIELKVPQIHELTRHKLDICVVYTHNKSECPPCEKHCIVISNETKEITWIYSPVVFAYSGSSDSTLWLSRWTFGDQFEEGDQVFVSLDMSCNVKEFWVNLLSEMQDEDASIVQTGEVMQLEHPSSHRVIGMYLSEYQLSTGVYLLIHHS